MPRRGAARALAAIALAAAGCGGPRLAPADAAARIERDPVPYAEFEQYVAGRVGLDNASPSPVLSGLLDQYLDELLLRRLAVEEGRAEPDTPGWQAVEALLADRPPPPISEEEIAAYYRLHADSFSRPERVVLNQVLAERSETAARVAERLSAGEDPATLPAVLGDDVSISQSEIAREDLPPAFVDRIFALAPGEVSEVIAADYGFHVFQVLARRPAEPAALAESRAAIVEELELQGRRRALDQVILEARGRYNVVVFARNLPFNYEGHYDSLNS